MTSMLNRRRLMALTAAMAAAPALGRATDAPIEVWWDDLVPGADENGVLYSALREMGPMIVGHFQSIFGPQGSAAMVEDYNDALVKVPGYLVPLSYDGTKVPEGLLVPYVGACIHVPPPPANQIVYVKLAEPAEGVTLWDPVWATGLFDTLAVETGLAEVGYIMKDASLAPFRS